MTDAPIPSDSEQTRPTIERPRLSNWVWLPWYAKLWWSLIVAYWTAGAGAMLFDPLVDFYTSSVAGFLNIALYPVFALLVLSIGWMRAWIEAMDYASANPDVKNNLGWEWLDEPDFHDRMTRCYRDPTNIYSPLSGNMFVGNPNNPLNGSYSRD